MKTNFVIYVTLHIVVVVVVVVVVILLFFFQIS